AAGLVLLLGQRAPGRWRALAAATLGVALVVAFRVTLFGHALPMALDAKPSTPLLGLTYVARGALVCFGITGLGLVGWAARASGPGRVYAWAVAAHLLALALAGGDWMPGFRLLAPIVPIYALALAEGWHGLRRARPRLSLGLLAVALMLPLIFSGLELPRLRASGRARDRRGAPLAHDLAALHGPVALVDVGYLGYRSGAPILDLGGVTDAVVARSPGGYLDKRIEPATLALREPVAIVLHAASAPELDARGNLRRLTGYPVERRIAAMAFVRLRYHVTRVVPYAPDYYYVLLTRRGFETGP
ncbi:MAG: hypothetical protein GXP55_22105, partial [Deltaproteobacteria bacterium]|nr:hypothetical protein [Deltaproteobacteria bacterium]